MNVPSFGILSAYEDPVMLGNALGFFDCLGYIYILMLLLTFKATVVFVLLFATLDVGFFTLAAANMTGNATCTQVGGIFVVISSICGWYGMISGMADNSILISQFIHFQSLNLERKIESKLAMLCILEFYYSCLLIFFLSFLLPSYN